MTSLQQQHAQVALRAHSVRNKRQAFAVWIEAELLTFTAFAKAVVEMLIEMSKREGPAFRFHRPGEERSSSAGDA